MRLDVFIAESGLAKSRTDAKNFILGGHVRVDGKMVVKPSLEVSPEERVEVDTSSKKYVSRGGLKLEAALDAFMIDPRGKRCIDVGASSGGFTDCLLQRGAKSVCAVDSGRGQLHSKLLDDIRVTSVEGFNAREMSSEVFGKFDVAVTDVSFISQTLLHLPICDVLCDGGIFVSLIKPQFEAGKSALGKGGIVKDPKDRAGAIIKVIESASCCGFGLVDVIASPINGGDGNREYLAFFKKGEASVLSGEQLKKRAKILCAD
jgi:23S rRNA (cytidine1920-2'-O)/16S rRNA (cytidine1409-2'-O)-methyltransferase